MTAVFKQTGSPTATITGTPKVGQPLTAALPAGIIGTLQFTRTLIAPPYTKSNITTAVAASVNNLSYTVQVTDLPYLIGIDSTVASPISVPVSADVPGAPSITSVTSGNGSLALAFSAPAFDGGNAISSYKVTLNDGSVATGAASPITVTGLANGTPYTAIVQALNAIGYGSSSAPSASVAPGQPTFAYFADYNVYVNSAQKALLNEPNRVLGVIKNISLGPISVLKTTEVNYQKNPGGSGWQTVLPGQEAVSDAGETVYVKTYSGTTTAMKFANGVVTVTMTAHNFVAGQSIYIQGAVPAAYNTSAQSQYPNVVTVASVTDANTFTYIPLLTPSGDATTQATIHSLATVIIERKVAT